MRFSLNKIYNCPYCQKPFTVLQGHTLYSILPVDVITGNEIHDNEYDRKNKGHRSHLLSCEKLQDIWLAKSEEYRKAVWERDNKAKKELLK
jgi:glutathionyl-hydroquinone reductase